MAEVVKAKEKKKIVQIEEKKKEKKVTKNTKNVEKKEEKKEEKKTLWEKFMTFWYGVGSEFKKVRWTSKKDMLKYSIATIVFIIFCSLFFYGIDTIFAFIQSLFN